MLPPGWGGIPCHCCQFIFLFRWGVWLNLVFGQHRIPRCHSGSFAFFSLLLQGAYSTELFLQCVFQSSPALPTRSWFSGACCATPSGLCHRRGHSSRQRVATGMVCQYVMRKLFAMVVLSPLMMSAIGGEVGSSPVDSSKRSCALLWCPCLRIPCEPGHLRHFSNNFHVGM